MKLSAYTLSLLADIEKRINPEAEEDFLAQWRRFWNGEVDGVIFTPKRKVLSQPSVEVMPININDAIGDYDLMLASQLGRVSEALASGSRALTVRANYGTGILSSLFGAEIFTMPREQNTLPTTRPLGDSDKMRALLDGGIPSLTSAFGRNVFEFGEMYLEICKNYPKIAKYVYMYHPDTQGPLDIAELLWGADMFYAMYDDTELVHSLMRLFTDTYRAFLDKWFAMYPNKEDLNAHWDFLMRGTICLRNDSAMNLAPEQYEEFAFPYDRELFDYYGGGILHYCGRGDHYIDILTALPSLTGINLSQPHLNDMDTVYRAAFGNGKRLLDLTRAACDDYEKQPDAVRGMIFCY